MSIIVKGMKMPDSCAVCSFAGKGGYHMERVVCMFTGKNEDAVNVDRLPDCPLIALPDKHGDLIDRDEAYDCIAEQEGGNYVDMDTVGKGLECAPTIVEAEDNE